MEAAALYDPRIRALAELELRRRAYERGDRMPEAWSEWFQKATPSLKAFAPFQKKSGVWVQALKPGARAVPWIDIWPRGRGKSTFAEHGVAYAAERQKRKFVLYVCATQEAAEIHLANVQAILERVGGPSGRRLENIYGHSKGWRRTMLRTASGFNAVAFGLDAAKRGAKIENYRPDLIILDDIDTRHDTLATTLKNIEIITESILPMGFDDLAVWGVQNLIIPNGVFARLADGRADFLASRVVNGPIKAVDNLVTEKRYWEEFGRSIETIVSGEPTWDVMGLDVCQQEIIDFGWAAFDREMQQNVKDVAGALWNSALINETRVREVEGEKEKTDHLAKTLRREDLTRIVVSVDPASKSKQTSNDTGIVASGRTADAHGYVLADRSGHYTPAAWGRQAVLLHDAIGATCIVYESNQGGEMADDVLQNAAKALHRDGLRASGTIETRDVSASKSKRARAEPVAQMYQEGTIHHVGEFPELETQMTTWNADDGSESPDRVDAMVWGMYELGVVREQSMAGLRLMYI